MSNRLIDPDQMNLYESINQDNCTISYHQEEYDAHGESIAYRRVLSEIETKEIEKIGGIEFLYKLNNNNYQNLNTYINSQLEPFISDESKKAPNYDSVIFALARFERLKDSFISWFIRNGFSIPKLEDNDPQNSDIEMDPLDLGDLSVTEHVEYLVNQARKDSKDNAPQYWKVKFKNEIKEASLYTLLGRVRKKFNKNHPDEIFNKNGMSWYKKS